jgi:cytochrome oxidase Cu insertion factor (SCO1/SenC/PrrC family)
MGTGLTLGLLVPLAWSCWAGTPARAGDLTDPESIHDPTLMLDSAPEGATVKLTDLGEGPYVVAPIFTRCRAVCNVLAKALKSAWENSEPEGIAARVVLVSFDPEDTREDMAHFRALFELPPSWHLATVEREEGLRFFSELGFQWRTLAKRQYDHSGKIFVLTDGLRIASVLGPDQLTAQRLGAEVTAAKTGASLARRIGTHWVGFFGVGVILLGLVVVVTWDKMRSAES